MLSYYFIIYYYRYCIDDDGNFLNMPRGTEFSYVPAQNREFIGRFVKFCMTTKILNENSHIYIKSHFRSVREVFEDYNQNRKGNPLNVRTCISKIDYDRRKLHKFFDADLVNLMFRVVKGVGKLPCYEKQLAAAMEVYSRGDLFEDKLVIKLDKTMNPEMPGREKIAKFLEIITPYIKYIKYKDDLGLSDEQAKNAHFHMLRHSSLSFEINNGVNIETAIKKGDWRSDKVPRKVYEHIYDSSQKIAASKYSILYNKESTSE